MALINDLYLKVLRTLDRDEEGQGLAEYVLILALIAIVAIVAAGVVNIVVYPFTATAAIPELRYRHAFVDRQAGFLISNVIPGGGAFAVGTQYSILSRYGVSANAAAAAVSAKPAFHAARRAL